MLEHVQDLVIEGELTVSFFFHLGVEITEHVGETAVARGDGPDALLDRERAEPMAGINIRVKL